MFAKGKEVKHSGGKAEVGQVMEKMVAFGGMGQLSNRVGLEGL